MPTGGLKDTIPPVLVGTHPKYKALNYKGNEVRLTFDEFIIPDQVSEVLVVSPPLEKRTTILTKSKTLIVRFNEDLQDSVTYSLDFKNSIVDNNERNAYENLRFVFSTCDRLDTLRVAGKSDKQLQSGTCGEHIGYVAQKSARFGSLHRSPKLYLPH